MSGAGCVAPAHASMGLPHLGYTTSCASMGLLQRCFLKSCSTRLRGGMVSPPVVIVYWLDILRHRAAATGCANPAVKSRDGFWVHVAEGSPAALSGSRSPEGASQRRVLDVPLIPYGPARAHR